MAKKSKKPISKQRQKKRMTIKKSPSNNKQKSKKTTKTVKSQKTKKVEQRKPQKTVKPEKQKQIQVENIKKQPQPAKNIEYTDASEETTQQIQPQHQQQINNEERFYCTNANLLREMFKWKNSTKKGIPVLKKINGKYVKTRSWKVVYKNETVLEKGEYKEVQVPYVLDEDGKMTKVSQNSELSCHEKYQKGVRYVIKYPLAHERASLIGDNKLNIVILRKSTKDGYLEDVTERVKRMGYAFDIDENELNRSVSNEFGMMLMKIGQKVSNHSFFRNYSRELKEDMQSYSYEKAIRGLPNYNFLFENAFAYLTQAFFNSFKSILSKHYKQVNIKRACTKRAMVQLQSNIPNSSMERCLGNQFRGNDFDSFEEF